MNAPLSVTHIKRARMSCCNKTPVVQSRGLSAKLSQNKRPSTQTLTNHGASTLFTTDSYTRKLGVRYFDETPCTERRSTIRNVTIIISYLKHIFRIFVRSLFMVAGKIYVGNLSFLPFTVVFTPESGIVASPPRTEVL